MANLEYIKLNGTVVGLSSRLPSPEYQHRLVLGFVKIVVSLVWELGFVRVMVMIV